MRKINQSDVKWQWRVDTYRVKCFCIYFCSCFPGAALPYGCRGVCTPAAARSEEKAQTGGAQKKQESQQSLLPEKRVERAIRWYKWVIHKLSQWRNNPEWGFLEQNIPGRAAIQNFHSQAVSWQISLLPKLLGAGGTEIPMLCSNFSSPKQFWPH